MPAEYDAIAEEYRASKLIPFRLEVEQPTLFDMLGDVWGLRVLDPACGEGIYSRWVRRLGAARVHGIDLSQGMVDLAEQTERQERRAAPTRSAMPASCPLGSRASSTS